MMPNTGALIRCLPRGFLFSALLLASVLFILGTIDSLFSPPVALPYLGLSFFVMIVIFPLLSLVDLPVRVQDSLPQKKSQVIYFGGLFLLLMWFFYAATLHVYFLRLLTTMVLPKGIIVYLVLGFCISGLAIHLFLDAVSIEIPLKKIFQKYSEFIMLIPIAFMILSVGIRIEQFGWTIPRYLIVLFCVYILLVCGISFFKKDHSLVKWICTLASAFSALAFLTIPYLLPL